MWPRNCGPASFQPLRATSLVSVHRPLRVAISRRMRRAGVRPRRVFGASASKVLPGPSPGRARTPVETSNATLREETGQASGLKLPAVGCDARVANPAPACFGGLSPHPGAHHDDQGRRQAAGRHTVRNTSKSKSDGCTIGPNPVQVGELTRGKKVVIFGLPGAFTPTCSAKHVPSYVAALRQAQGQGRRRRSRACRSTTRS